jgi:hypothetical protein
MNATKSTAVLLGSLGFLGAGAYAVYAAYSPGAKPPKPTIVTKPAKNTATTWAGFRFRDAWSDTTFQCSLDGKRFGRCANPKSYRALAGGWHAFRVRALAGDSAGAAAKYPWWIDGRPPRPRIIARPSRVTTSTRARFSFASRERGLRYQCRLDRRARAWCRSPVRYARLAPGRHVFSVRAKDPDATMSRPTRLAWRVVNEIAGAATVAGPDFAITLTPDGGDFDVSGRTALYPGGPADALALTFDNPTGETIYITALSVRVTDTPTGCGDVNFHVTQSNVGETNAVAVPPHGSATLPTQGVSAPRLALVDRPVNQDACQNAQIGFAFTASAHS